MEICAKSLSEAWELSIKKLLDDNVPYVYTQRGVRAKEISGMQLVVEMPLSEPILSEYYVFGEMFVEKYCQSIMEASCGEQSIHSRIVKTKKFHRKITIKLIEWLIYCGVNLIRAELLYHYGMRNTI